jgi:hypothetical protein
MHMHTHEDFINMIWIQNIVCRVQNILNINFEDRKEYVMLIISILYNLRVSYILPWIIFYDIYFSF